MDDDGRSVQNHPLLSNKIVLLRPYYAITLNLITNIVNIPHWNSSLRYRSWIFIFLKQENISSSIPNNFIPMNNFSVFELNLYHKSLKHRHERIEVIRRHRCEHDVSHNIKEDIIIDSLGVSVPFVNLRIQVTFIDWRVTSELTNDLLKNEWIELRSVTTGIHKLFESFIGGNREMSTIPSNQVFSYELCRSKIGIESACTLTHTSVTVRNHTILQIVISIRTTRESRILRIRNYDLNSFVGECYITNGKFNFLCHMVLGFVCKLLHTTHQFCLN